MFVDICVVIAEWSVSKCKCGAVCRMVACAFASKPLLIRTAFPALPIYESTPAPAGCVFSCAHPHPVVDSKLRVQAAVEPQRHVRHVAWNTA